MVLHIVKKGLDLPITGAPVQVIESGAMPRRVALLAEDYLGLKPTLLVQTGDTVRRGQTLFEDKKTPGVRFTAPCAGTVLAIHRGERRALQSVVIAVNSGSSEQVAFQCYTGSNLVAYDRPGTRALLAESGLWTAFRTRPFSHIPHIDSVPFAIFVAAALIFLLLSAFRFSSLDCFFFWTIFLGGRVPLQISDNKSGEVHSVMQGNASPVYALSTQCKSRSADCAI